MAIRTVVTRGFGNGTFNGTIALVVVRGYAPAPAAPAAPNRHTIHRGSGVTFSNSVREDFRIGQEDVSQES